MPRRGPLLAKSRGCVVNIASMLAFFGGRQRRRRAAHEIAGNCLRSRIESASTLSRRAGSATPLTQALQDDHERSAALLARTPLGRWGEPADIAGTVVFLCSPAAEFVTGAVIPSTVVIRSRDGGGTMRVTPTAKTVRQTPLPKMERHTPIEQAVRHLEAGEWKAAHALVQKDATSLGCWAHGIVHLIEGDLENAKYWYRRAHRPLPHGNTAVAEDRRVESVAARSGTQRAAPVHGVRAAASSPRSRVAARFPTTSASGCRRRRTSGSVRCCSTRSPAAGAICCACAGPACCIATAIRCSSPAT